MWASNMPKALAAGAQPRTLLGELTPFPHTPWSVGEGNILPQSSPLPFTISTPLDALGASILALWRSASVVPRCKILTTPLSFLVRYFNASTAFAIYCNKNDSFIFAVFFSGTFASVCHVFLYVCRNTSCTSSVNRN